jgi:hypothetical protein
MWMGEQPQQSDPTQIKEPGGESIGSTNLLAVSKAFKEGFEAGLMEPGWQVPCCGYAPSDHKNNREWHNGYEEGERQRTANTEADRS